MGLAGRKEKQRIGEDPRNTRWANDTSNPGYKMLAGMGWSPNTSLGGPSAPAFVSGNPNPSSSTLGLGAGLGAGSTTATTWKRMPGSVLPIAKSDTRGLGASLNSAALTSFLPGQSAPAFVTAGKGALTEEEGGKKPGSGGLGDLFARLNKASASATSSGVSTPKEVETEGDGRNEKTRKRAEKEKRRAEKALRKALKTEKKEKKKKRKSGSDEAEATEKVEVELKDGEREVVSLPAAAVITSASGAKIVNPRMASRAKYLASKRLATATNAAAMAEILGISAPAPTSASTPASTTTPVPDPVAETKASEELVKKTWAPMSFVKSLGASEPKPEEPTTERVAVEGVEEAKEVKKSKKRKWDKQSAVEVDVEVEGVEAPVVVEETKVDKKEKKRRKKDQDVAATTAEAPIKAEQTKTKKKVKKVADASS